MNQIKKLKHEKYSELINKIKTYTKPIMILGPVGCGRATAIKQAAEELKLGLYYLGSVKNKKDFIGIDNLNTKDVPSNFFLAYIKGGILFVDDTVKRNVEFIKQLISLAKKEYIGVNKEKYLRHKDFKVVLSCDNTNDLIINYIEREFVKKKELEIIDFDYDLNIEKSICPNKEFLEFFWEARKYFSEVSFYQGTTTTALNRCVKLLDTKVFTPEDIVESLFIKGYNKNTLRELHYACNHLGPKNKYLQAIKNIAYSDN